MWTRSLQSDLLPHVSSAKSLLGLPSTTALAPSRSLPHATECQLKWLAGCLLLQPTRDGAPECLCPRSTTLLPGHIFLSHDAQGAVGEQLLAGETRAGWAPPELPGIVWSL